MHSELYKDIISQKLILCFLLGILRSYIYICILSVTGAKCLLLEGPDAWGLLSTMCGQLSQAPQEMKDFLPPAGASCSLPVLIWKLGGWEWCHKGLV